MLQKSATTAFLVLQRPFLAVRCGQRSPLLPLSPLSWQQHRRVFAAVSLRNSNILCGSSYPYRFGEESSYGKELLVVERRRDELESLLEACNREAFLRSGYSKGSIGYEKKWLDKLEMVINFYHKMGRLPKLTAVGEEGKLAIWIDHQRTAKQCLDEGKLCTNKMTPERIAILESMSWWIWDAQEAVWQEKFEEFVDYVKRTGKIPPVSHPTLGVWVSNQRIAHQAWKARLNGEIEKYRDVTNCMNEERAGKLESVPGWKWDMRD